MFSYAILHIYVAKTMKIMFHHFMQNLLYGFVHFDMPIPESCTLQQS